jgi:ribose transport system substrate-binding protein
VQSYRWFLAVLAAATISAGCGPQPDKTVGPGGPNRVLQIAVIPKGETHEFWKSVHAGAQQAADEAGNVKILWKGPHNERDREGQINIVQDFITQGVNGICLAPIDARALVTYVREAHEEGIPTVIFDSGLDDNSPVSYVATNNYQGGMLAARHLGKVLEGKGGVILIRYNQGSESTEQREVGFLETINKEFPQIEVLSSDQYSGTTPDTCLSKAQDLLTQFQGKVDGVFAVCEPISVGMLQALENDGLAGKVKFVAFDPSPKLVTAMASKKIDAIVLQDPLKMGYLAVKSMLDHLNGKQVEKKIGTGEFVATPDNMNEPDMKKLLNPVQFGDHASTPK